MSAVSGKLSQPASAGGSRVASVVRALRGGLFFVFYSLYVTLIFDAGLRLVVRPLMALFPRTRGPLIAFWFHWGGRVTVGMARVLAGVRTEIAGTLPGESCLVVMNHQSLFDIAILFALVRRPYPVIPTRDRYRRRIPGVSLATRTGRFPFLSQRRQLTREELAALTDAARRVERGESTLAIFPEGHRTRDGDIGPFMRNGLRIIFANTSRPVYCVVTDGLAHSRTMAEAIFGFAGSRVRGTILGPFNIPAGQPADLFIDTLRQHMIAALDRLRSPSSSRGAGAAGSGIPR